MPQLRKKHLPTQPPAPHPGTLLPNKYLKMEPSTIKPTFSPSIDSHHPNRSSSIYSQILANPSSDSIEPEFHTYKPRTPSVSSLPSIADTTSIDSYYLSYNCPERPGPGPGSWSPDSNTDRAVRRRSSVKSQDTIRGHGTYLATNGTLSKVGAEDDEEEEERGKDTQQLGFRRPETYLATDCASYPDDEEDEPNYRSPVSYKPTRQSKDDGEEVLYCQPPISYKPHKPHPPSSPSPPQRPSSRAHPPPPNRSLQTPHQTQDNDDPKPIPGARLPYPTFLTRLLIAHNQAQLISKLRDYPRTMTYALTALDKANQTQGDHKEGEEREGFILSDTWLKIGEAEIAGWMREMRVLGRVVGDEGKEREGKGKAEDREAGL